MFRKSVLWIALFSFLPTGSISTCKAGESLANGKDFVCADLGAAKARIVNAAGKITWEYPAPGIHDIWQLSNGNILFNTKHGAKMVTLKKEIVWEYKTQAPNEVFTVQPLKNGNILVAQSADAKIMEIDLQGNIQKEIPIITKTKNPHGQFRLCRKTKQGTYLVGYIAEHKVAEYNSDGKIIFEVNTPVHAFQAVRLDNGNTLIACGEGHQIIEVNKAGDIVWQIKENDLPNNPLRFVAGVQRLTNGNTLVTNWGGHGHVGGQPQFFEVTPDKKVVWEYFDYETLKTPTHIQLLGIDGNEEKGDFHR